MPLHTNLFLETNPAPPKYALSRLGLMSVAGPIGTIGRRASSLIRPRRERAYLGGAGLVSKNREAVDFALRHAGLINH
jgi:hypothetical protein